jgi:hypothetical protein
MARDIKLKRVVLGLGLGSAEPQIEKGEETKTYR